jgi:hypothetical protein
MCSVSPFLALLPVVRTPYHKFTKADQDYLARRKKGIYYLYRPNKNKNWYSWYELNSKCETRRTALSKRSELTG